LDILFANQSMEKTLNEARSSVRAYGSEQAKVIAKRLTLMRAAASLADLMDFPGKCHALSGDRAGTFAIALRGPYRLIFEPANEPLPQNQDGSLDVTRVTIIRILYEREDYHG
jgi:proteic killer suppression protein